MKITIEVKGENSQMQVQHLKKHLEKSQIKELKEIKVTRAKPKEGEMGRGVISSLTAVLISLSGPFSRFAQAFTTYASSFRTEIILKNEYGDELVLNTKNLDKEGINHLVEKFLDKKSIKTTKTTTKTATKSQKTTKTKVTKTK